MDRYLAYWYALPALRCRRLPVTGSMKYALWILLCVAAGIVLGEVLTNYHPVNVLGWCSEQRGTITVQYHCWIAVPR